MTACSCVTVEPCVRLRSRDLVHVVKRIAILGSTGSIGQSALPVVDAHPDRLQVVGLAAGENAELSRRADRALPAARRRRWRPARRSIGCGDSARRRT